MHEPKQKWVNRIFHPEHWKVVAAYLTIYDILAVNAAYFLALWLRFDCRFGSIPTDYLNSYLRFIPIYTIFCVIIFRALRLYKSIWRFASFGELIRVTAATGITVLFHTVGVTLVHRQYSGDLFQSRMPMSYYVFGAILQFILILSIRFSYRMVLVLRKSGEKGANKDQKRVMLIGAGEAGQMILRDIRHADELHDRVCCIIDDNPNKWQRYIEGVPVVGGREDILKNVKKYDIDKIYVAIPSASPEQKRDILAICNETGCELKDLPGMYQLASGEVTASALKKVAVEDLLGREPIRVNMDEIFSYLKDKVILVTGGGGSIGSELCRQIAGHGPKRLIIFDVYENNAYEIQQELRKNYPELDLKVLIGSVRDSRRIDAVFAEYRPDVVYHAAAHKHVPLMEDSPGEAIRNNVLGTYKTAHAAMRNGCRRFVLISTDKAVNPTNIMGASKRLCEMIIQTFDRKIKEGCPETLPVLHSHTYSWETDCEAEEELNRLNAGDVKTEFVAVRFGNVLGSNGSVIPLFKKQIAAGGPVTVTHPDIIRYFMTIPEAVSLVLQAGVYAKGGEIFVLDMGSPVKIDTLARNLIRLSGYKPDVDIKIQYTGLRPGEKLYEEKLMEEEGLQRTPNHLIHVGKPIEFDADSFLRSLTDLIQMSYQDRTALQDIVAGIVDTYHPDRHPGLQVIAGERESAVRLKKSAERLAAEKRAAEGSFAGKKPAEGSPAGKRPIERSAAGEVKIRRKKSYGT